jgi:hypothetical protein
MSPRSRRFRVSGPSELEQECVHLHHPVCSTNEKGDDTGRVSMLVLALLETDAAAEDTRHGQQCASKT